MPDRDIYPYTQRNAGRKDHILQLLQEVLIGGKGEASDLLDNRGFVCISDLLEKKSSQMDSHYWKWLTRIHR